MIQIMLYMEKKTYRLHSTKRTVFVSVEMKISQGKTQTQSQLGKTDILLSQELRSVENF